MTARYLRAAKPLAAIIVIGALGACSSDMTGSNLHPVKVSFMSSAATPAASTTAFRSNFRSASDLAVGTGDLVLTKVQLVMDKIELNETETTDCVAEIEQTGNDNSEAGTECEDVERNPVVIDVPLNAGLVTALNVPLAAGTYSKLEAKLEPARDDATAFNTANPNLVGQSVRVEGTYKGTPFVFTSSVRTGLEMSFNPALVIDATTLNATVSIDVANWFLDGSGAVIDPNTATPGSSALQTIEDNIHRSFHAFEDDDESGTDDGGHHSGE
jgi:hypothetical protein